MSTRDIIGFLFKWKFSLVGYFVFIVAIVTALVYVLPQKYEAKAVVLVESSRAPTMRSEVAFGVKSLSVLNSETAIIRSSPVISSVVDGLGTQTTEYSSGRLAQLLDSFSQWRIDVGLSQDLTPRDRLFSQLSNRLRVEPLANSDVIVISYRDKNPGRAAKVVNAITNSYIGHHIKVFSSDGTSDVYRSQLVRLEEDLQRRRKALEDYKRDSEFSAVSDTMRTLVQQQSAYSTELGQARRELAELQTRFESGHTKVSLALGNVTNIKNSLEDIRKKLQLLEFHETEIQNAEMGIRSVEKSFQELQERYNEERLTSIASPDIANVRVIAYADVPMQPLHSRLFYIILAILGGAVVSFAVALLKEYLDRSVNDPDIVAELLGVPLLGSIERIRRPFGALVDAIQRS